MRVDASTAGWVPGIRLHIGPPYRAALKELDGLSHRMAFWRAGQFNTPEYRRMLTCNPPYAAGHLTGMFTPRSPIRPNPVMMPPCRPSVPAAFPGSRPPGTLTGRGLLVPPVRLRQVPAAFFA